MGYLNYNLEKVASVIETGLEKQALSLGRLVGMGVNAAKRGKLDHFAKRLAQRNTAMQNVHASRSNAFKDANNKAWFERSFLGTNAGPVSRNAIRLGRRVPNLTKNNTRIRDMQDLSLKNNTIDREEFAHILADRRPIPMDSFRLGNIARMTRENRPDLWKNIIA